MTYILIPLIKEKTTKEQRDNAMFWIKIAIQSAEKRYENYDGKMGDKKKLMVLSYLQDKGIELEMDDLNNIIDATVEEMFNKDK